MRVLPGSVTSGVRTVVERFVRHERVSRGVQSLSEPDVLARMLKVYSFYSSGMKEQLFQPWLKNVAGTDEAIAAQALGRLQRDVEDLDPLTQMLYVDTRASLPDDLLMVADKLSMANGVEARVPYLDYQLVEFVESIPVDLKLKGLQGKYLHKKALSGLGAREVAYRPKKGFDESARPVASWASPQRHLGVSLA